MADSVFQKGDVVQLASGGPRMTVCGPSDYGSDSDLSCEWFDGKGNKHREDFDSATLIKPSTPQAAPGIVIRSFRRS